MSTITPLLSIGIIFKNEERCLERCLQSLEPLRQAIPCELVMADTGAEDDSRKIAEQYADLVFDFPWINDFAAARNAVMDRCCGKWYLTIDCDEWLDEDISELLIFLKEEKKANQALVIQRNYSSAELEKGDAYSDFRALRLMRLSTKERYHGAIHESWYYQKSAKRLLHTILHHDGYFYVDPEVRKKKLQRNMKLLRQQLKQNPENLRTLNQCIESSGGDVDFVQYVRKAVEVVQKKHSNWEEYGGSILRHAVQAAWKLEMPELDEWIAYGESAFPNSILVLVDMHYAAFMVAHRAKEWQKAVWHGEIYRKGIRILRTVPLPKEAELELGRSSVRTGTPDAERTLLTGLADAYHQNRQSEQALEVLRTLDGEKLFPKQVRNAVITITQIHATTLLDVSSVLTNFYESIHQEIPDRKKQAARLTAFDAIAAGAFTAAYQKEEQQKDNYRRPAYTAFLALADRCEAGRAAAIMTADGPDAMCAVLQKVEDWQALPVEALQHALAAGVAFPLAEKPLNQEILDGLAAKLTAGENTARQLALALPDTYPDWQSLQWAQSLVLAALRSFDWTLGKKDAPASKFARPQKKKQPDERPADTAETGLALIRRFAQVEALLLPLLYTPQALTDQNAALLPPMHRWGLYCTRALAALEAGDPQQYLALLRSGLKACPGEKAMVQFLLDRFRQDTRPQAAPELLALAQKVRAILAAYDPADPAVAALRQSPVYQQVAWLIEDTPDQTPQ